LFLQEQIKDIIINDTAINYVQSTLACASGYRVRQSRGFRLFWNESSVLALTSGLVDKNRHRDARLIDGISSQDAKQTAIQNTGPARSGCRL
jgi:hypothetical protein